MQLPRRARVGMRALGIVLALATFSTGCAADTPSPQADTLRRGEDPPEWSGPYRVTKVIDGDTIRVDKLGAEVTVRIVGIDTPEVSGPYTSQECYGPEASAQGRELLAGRDVWLQTAEGQNSQDRYDRDLAFVFLNDTTDYGRVMLREGYARQYETNVAHQYTAAYRAAQESAKMAGRGLWSPAAC